MKLSGWQLFCIIITAEILTVIGAQISPAIQIAKQDAWIVMLVGGVISIALTLFIVHLGKRHPNQTLVPLSQALLGSWLGRIIVVPFLIAWYIRLAVLLRTFSDFLHLMILDQTPVWVIMIPLVCLITYLTYSAGITGIGRYCEIVGPIIIFVLIVIFILSATNAEWHHLLPIYADSGWTNILKGAIVPASFFVDPFILLVIIPFMQRSKKALSKPLLGVGISVFMVLTATLMVLLVLGPNLSAKLRYPFVTFAKTIDILNFIQNVDIFIDFIWIFGLCGQLSIYLFITSYEMAQWLHVKDWRKMVWFGVPAIFILAILIPNETTITVFYKYWVSWIFPVCGVGIPLILWLVSVVKKKSVKL